ncbi:MAG: hypothetical protein Q8R82_14295 [Hyphomonadaceae bacterium]|nr:hypothetical protein [Hyphomonadaceae bacterium]
MPKKKERTPEESIQYYKEEIKTWLFELRAYADENDHPNFKARFSHIVVYVSYIEDHLNTLCKEASNVSWALDKLDTIQERQGDLDDETESYGDLKALSEEIEEVTQPILN